MSDAAAFLREIDGLPVHKRQEVYDFILFLKQKEAREQALELSFASEAALARDWLRPEEDAAWAHL